MKILLIILGVILVLFIAFQIYITMSIFKTETPTLRRLRLRCTEV